MRKSMTTWLVVLAACQGPTEVRDNAAIAESPEREAAAPAVAEPAALTEVEEESPQSTGRKVEATSLLGAELLRPVIRKRDRAALEANLQSARAELDAHPSDEMALIWYGRRLAYLGCYRAAVRAFSAGAEQHPESFKILRHRGHRLLTLRKLDFAVRDLGAAARLVEGVEDEIEPDGAPNAHGIPRSTTRTNIHYHLGLGLYLQGKYLQAARAYDRCLSLCRNDDMRVATLYWAYLTQRRLGDGERAAALLADVGEEMDILENDGYHQLLLLYRGERSEPDLAAADDGVENATLAYGLAMKELLDGDAAAARQSFEAIVAGETWMAFGHLAAEAELARGDADGP